MADVITTSGTATTAAPLTSSSSPTTAAQPEVKPIQPYSVSGALSTPREIKEKETVAGQMKGLLSEESPYTTMARTRAAEAANKRGLLNTTMGVQAGETAAIESALPIAQQDAKAYETAAMTAQEYGHKGALSAQESAQTMAQDVNKGQITKELTAQEYDLKTKLMEREYQQKGVLSSQEHQQTMGTLAYEWSQKSGLSAQEAGQQLNAMIKEYALRNDLTELEASLEINRMNQQMTNEEFRAVQDDLRKQRMVRLETEMTKTLDDNKAKWDFEIRQMMEQNSFNIATLQDLGNTTRTQYEVASRNYIQELGIESSDRQFAMNMMTSFGDQFQAALANISMSNLDSAAKGAAILNALNMYRSMSTTAAKITGLSIEWPDVQLSVPGGGNVNISGTGSGSVSGTTVGGSGGTANNPPPGWQTQGPGGTTQTDWDSVANSFGTGVTAKDVQGRAGKDNVDYYFNRASTAEKQTLADRAGITVAEYTNRVENLARILGVPIPSTQTNNPPSSTVTGTVTGTTGSTTTGGTTGGTGTGGLSAPGGGTAGGDRDTPPTPNLANIASQLGVSEGDLNSTNIAWFRNNLSDADRAARAASVNMSLSQFNTLLAQAEIALEERRRVYGY